LAPGESPRRKLITYVKDRPGHDRRYAMDSTKIEQELGWKAQYSLETGLRETVLWYLKNMAWVQAIRKQAQFMDWIDKNYTERK